MEIWCRGQTSTRAGCSFSCIGPSSWNRLSLIYDCKWFYQKHLRIFEDALVCVSITAMQCFVRSRWGGSYINRLRILLCHCFLDFYECHQDVSHLKRCYKNFLLWLQMYCEWRRTVHHSLTVVSLLSLVLLLLLLLWTFLMDIRSHRNVNLNVQLYPCALRLSCNLYKYNLNL